MKFSLTSPTDQQLSNWLSKQHQQAFSYQEVGATAFIDFPEHYAHDRNACLLGKGDLVFEKAKKALRNWEMFNTSWTKVYPPPIPFEVDKEVVILARALGLWSFNCCRIIYTFDEPKRFGFGYGTLDNHMAKGEETFFVEMKENGAVWYHLQSFSQPSRWWLRLTKPFMRYQQQKFAQCSLKSMQAAVLNDVG